MSQLRKLATGIALCALAAAATARATPITWASLTADDPAAGTVSGTLTGTFGSIGVTYSGGYAFDELNGSGFNYWGAVPVPPPDIIALAAAGTGTITFSKPVTDVFIAFDSWNGAQASFSAPFSVVSTDCSYWGCGTFVVNSSNTGFFGSGEAAGVLEFAGTFSSLSFTDTTAEYWHGFTVGIAGPAVTPVPEPATWATMLVGLGLVGLGARARRRRHGRIA